MEASGRLIAILVVDTTMKYSTFLIQVCYSVRTSPLVTQSQYLPTQKKKNPTFSTYILLMQRLVDLLNHLGKLPVHMRIRVSVLQIYDQLQAGEALFRKIL